MVAVLAGTTMTGVGLTTAASASTRQAAAASSSSLTVGVPELETVFDQPQGVPAIFVGEDYMGTLVDYAPQTTGQTSLVTSKFVPDLATSWTKTAQGEVFTLRAAKAPDGDVLSPADVKYTYDRYVATKDFLAAFLMKEAGINTTNPVTILGPHTVRLNGNITPLGSLGWQFYWFSILDSKLVKQHATASDPWATKWLATHTASYGPYSVSYFKPGSEAILTANPNYWGGPLPYSKVTVLAIASGQSASALLRSGTVQWVSWAPALDYKQLKGSKAYNSFVAPQVTQDVVELNQSYAPLSNANVRRAMSMAIDRPALLAGPYDGVGRAATTVGSWGVPAFSGITGQYYSYNLAAAKALLQKSPYPSGFSFTLAYNPGSGSSADEQSVLINLQADWQQLGINVTLDPVVDPAQFSSGQQSGAYEAYFWGEGPILADGAYDMSLYHISGGLSNYTHEKNAQVDKLTAEALATPLGAGRDRLVATAARVWNSEMYDLPIMDTAEPYLSAKNVCGFATYPYQNPLYRLIHPC